MTPDDYDWRRLIPSLVISLFLWWLIIVAVRAWL